VEKLGGGSHRSKKARSTLCNQFRSKIHLEGKDERAAPRPDFVIAWPKNRTNDSTNQQTLIDDGGDDGYDDGDDGAGDGDVDVDGDGDGLVELPSPPAVIHDKKYHSSSVPNDNDPPTDTMDTDP